MVLAPAHDCRLAGAKAHGRPSGTAARYGGRRKVAGQLHQRGRARSRCYGRLGRTAQPHRDHCSRCRALRQRRTDHRCLAAGSRCDRWTCRRTGRRDESKEEASGGRPRLAEGRPREGREAETASASAAAEQEGCRGACSKRDVDSVRLNDVERSAEDASDDVRERETRAHLHCGSAAEMALPPRRPDMTRLFKKVQ